MKRPVRTLILAFGIVFSFLTPSSASAGESGGKPISLGLFPPVQIVPEKEGISGFRFSLFYGSNAFMQGFDLGLVNHVSGKTEGFQWGFVDFVEDDFTGWQWSWADIQTAGTFKGFQCCIYNQAKNMEGLQLGFVNVTETMDGLQLGLVNIIMKGGMLPVFIIFNASFR
jgi:hypothetical protein